MFLSMLFCMWCVFFPPCDVSLRPNGWLFCFIYHWFQKFDYDVKCVVFFAFILLGNKKLKKKSNLDINLKNISIPSFSASIVCMLLLLILYYKLLIS